MGLQHDTHNGVKGVEEGVKLTSMWVILWSSFYSYSDEREGLIFWRRSRKSLASSPGYYRQIITIKSGLTPSDLTMNVRYAHQLYKKIKYIPVVYGFAYSLDLLLIPRLR